jgi:hypothetical protein
MTLKPDTRRDILIDSMKSTGLSPEKFAQQVLGRDRSTIYRWLAGKTKVPTSVARYLTHYWKPVE